MDIQSLQIALQDPSFASLAIVFGAGFVFAFNPIVFASIPLVLAYVTRAHEPRQTFLLGGAFVVGMLVTHVLLGVAAALGGDWAQEAMGRRWVLVLGPVLIFLGFMWPGWIKIRIPWLVARGRKVTGVGGAFLLGIPFTVALCPNCTPALLTTITASAGIGSVTFGATLLLAFGLGRCVPILVGAWGFGWLESVIPMARYHRIVEAAGGVTLILTGLYLLNQYFFII